MTKGRDGVATAHSELVGAVYMAHPNLQSREQARLVAAFEGYVQAVVREALEEHERQGQRQQPKKGE